ncbi:MAG: hypothetical protein ACTSRU_21380, partial [Candidatus Hodarchaeales archaeon]
SSGTITDITGSSDALFASSWVGDGALIYNRSTGECLPLEVYSTEMAVFYDDTTNELFIGGNGNSLYKYDLSNQNLTYFNYISDSTTWFEFMFGNKGSELLFGAAGKGITIFNRTSEKYYNINSSSHGLVSEYGLGLSGTPDDSVIFFATPNGLILYFPENNTIRNPNPATNNQPDYRVQDILYDQVTGILYGITGSSELFEYSYMNDTISTLSGFQRSGTYGQGGIAIDNDLDLIYSSGGSSLIILNRSDSSVFSRNYLDGLPGKEISGIWVDQSTHEAFIALWDYGIVKYDPLKDTLWVPPSDPWIHFIYPSTNGLTLSNTVTVQWNYGDIDFSSGGHIELAYSTDGTSWTVLLTTTTENSYSWDTTQFDNGEGILRIEIIKAGDPWIHFIYPSSDGLTLSNTITVQWNYGDIDFSSGGYIELAYSADGTSWTVLMTTTTENSYSWDTTQFDNGEGILRIEIIKDSIILSDDTHYVTIDNEQVTGDPWIHFIYPSSDGLTLSNTVTVQWDFGNVNLSAGGYIELSYFTGSTWKVLLRTKSDITFVWDTTNEINGEGTLKLEIIKDSNVLSADYKTVIISNNHESTESTTESSISSSSPSTSNSIHFSTPGWSAFILFLGIAALVLIRRRKKH